ncbi:hypothetical protein OGR47_20680 (plasmid) [Methylocystis sp. MJC1]|jgi:hypothetical protein|uniref:hypothetical protein n=1 Tax=Methylocystis sp. MJC1 TaxID=2654282 RepID=UPI0013EC9B04|nr:hypothetical protein [Methylocystis sp. MJC1]KAF2989284.1 hypothetical protein MJC1_03602 [Methylocystis sp. MJC1]MBU6529314.1 hypothetical protein [Methylocystis sp. MJC1]UZX14174.1 hypothetical protein OGR47_20680 [Methylocystis sp. MJC1]
MLNDHWADAESPPVIAFVAVMRAHRRMGDALRAHRPHDFVKAADEALDARMAYAFALALSLQSYWGA